MDSRLTLEAVEVMIAEQRREAELRRIARDAPVRRKPRLSSPLRSRRPR